MPSFLRRLAGIVLSLIRPPRRDPGYGAHLYGGELAGFEGNETRDMDSFPDHLTADHRRRLGYWPGEEERPDFARAYRETGDETLERPWNYNWNRLPKRSAGPGFSRDEYRAARDRGREVCRVTIGDERWGSLVRDGFLDVPSACIDGLTYRLRPGRRVQVLCRAGVESPWYYEFLCINPVYPLPEYEFLAQLFLYVRDQEEEVLRVAAPQPWDQALGRTF